MIQNPKIDLYLEEGCGRCPRYQTPDCKVHTWQQELRTLRRIVLETGLQEELKWSFPCYTHNGKNIVMIGTLNECATLSFFNGALLKDEAKILTKPGENSNYDRYFKTTDTKKILELEQTLKAYIFESIDNSIAGRKVQVESNPEPILEEFQQILEQNPQVKAAFDALTPGRKRGYIIHFSQPKQSKTRIARIEKLIPKILEGKGFHDR
jgi:uncharacterized protein YdeI (YjbR/CyaY-like superfamily)